MDTVLDPRARHAAIICDFWDAIEDKFLRALRDGDTDPTVMVFDARDGRAMEILQNLRSRDEVTAELGEARRRGAYFVAAFGVERARAVELLREHFPSVATDLANIVAASGWFPVVTLAHGGAAASLVPLPGEAS
jgi:hypothetical protein